VIGGLFLLFCVMGFSLAILGVTLSLVLLGFWNDCFHLLVEADGLVRVGFFGCLYWLGCRECVHVKDHNLTPIGRC